MGSVRYTVRRKLRAGGKRPSLITKEETDWVRLVVMPKLGLRKVSITEDLEHTAKYPDIWTDGKTITVTREWARQKPWERRKRLLHELFHCTGLDHNKEIGFNSRPRLDSFSRKMMREFEAVPSG